MGIRQFIRKMRGRHADDEAPAFAREWHKEHGAGLAGLTDEELDERARRALNGHEDELREALEESDAYLAKRRRERRS